MKEKWKWWRVITISNNWIETSRTWGQFEPQSFPFPWPQQPPIYHLQTIFKVKVKACTPISALWLWSPPHQGPSKLSPYQPAHSSLDRTGHFLLRQEHSGRDLHFTPSIKLRDFPRLRGPPQNPTKLITRLLKPTFVDDTGCFVLGRPYGRRGVLSLFDISNLA